jgi:hypothetical protein
VTVRPIPRRHWRSYGDEPLPTGTEALDEPFRAFPSWFLRITCDRCGKDRMLSETHFQRGDMLIRDIIARGRHDGCAARQGRRSCSRHRGRRKLLAGAVAISASQRHTSDNRRSVPHQP